MARFTDEELSAPFTDPGAVKRRLYHARRELEGLTIGDWHRRIEGGGYSISPSSVKKYEDYPNPSSIPADYIARVCHVFGYRFEWVMHGSGDPKGADSVEEAEDVEERLLEGQIFGDLANVLNRINWQDVACRMELLQVLDQVQRATDVGARDAQARVEAVLSYLEAVVPNGRIKGFARLLDIPPHQRQQVVFHVRSLLYLMYEPFRARDESFVRSRTVSPTEASSAPKTEEE